jgi:hypothetical protein
MLRQPRDCFFDPQLNMPQKARKLVVSHEIRRRMRCLDVAGMSIPRQSRENGESCRSGR